MDEPVETFSACCDVVCHDFAEALIVGDDEQVDHDDVAQFETIDEIGNAHLAESIKDDDGGSRMRFDVVIHLLEENASVLHFCHWEKDQLYWFLGAIRLEPLVKVVDGEDLHLVDAEVFEGDELSEQRFEHFIELVLVYFEKVLNREYF